MSVIDLIAGGSSLGHDLKRAKRDVRSGKMTILIDRNGYGHLYIAATHASADAINFMAAKARGLVCMVLTQDRADALGLVLQPCRSDKRRQPRFTVSIEARLGVTTGISAHDRARTIAVAVDASCDASDLVSPGHVFPMIAAENAPLKDFGQCEAAIELTRMADVRPAGIMCAILDESGEMAAIPYLSAFASRHGLAVVSVRAIAARWAWRRTIEALLMFLDPRRWWLSAGEGPARYGMAA